MGRTTGSKNKQVSADQLNATLSVEERIEFLANLIAEKLSTIDLTVPAQQDKDQA